MKRTITFAGFLTGLCIFLAVLGLGISPVSAAGNPFSFNGTGSHSMGNGTHITMNATQQQERLQSAITKLGTTGVDITEPQADLTSGNLKGAMTWLMTYHKDHPGTQVNGSQHVVNATRMTERLQSFVTGLSSKGVDVTQLQADIAAGNMNATMQWLAAYHKDNPVQGNATCMQWGNTTTQTARLQSALTKLGTQGVDVSQPQAEITNGDTKSAMQWLAAYHKAHPVQGNTTRMQWGNSTAQKSGTGSTLHHRIPKATNTTSQP